MNRRQALRVIAATAAVPAGMLGLSQFAPAAKAATWQGECMGVDARMTLWHQNEGVARRVMALVAAEAKRLDAVFSLYNAESEIVRLNRDGVIAKASPDLIAALEMALAVAEVSGGAFDPTVQPLWQLYSAHFADERRAGGPDARVLAAARARVDYRKVDIDARRIAYRSETAITLNAVAQGYVTDRVTDLLRNEGFEHAMVDFGETRALGAALDGSPFSISLRDPLNPGHLDREVTLADAALSVSGGYGFRFGEGPLHHIFDPKTGGSPSGLADVVVIANTAAVADCLSTAIYVAGENGASRLLAAYPGSRAELTRADGTRISV